MANKNRRTRCYVHTLPGIEEIAWLEIRQRLAPVDFVETLYIKNQQGLAVFDYGGDLRRLDGLRTAEDVFLQAVFVPKLSRTKRDLNQIRTLVAQGESFGQATNALMRLRAFSKPPTFSVVSQKAGQHQYKLRDVTKAVLAGLAARLPRWSPVAQGGQVVVDVNLIGSKLLVGLRVTEESLSRRYGRHKTPHASWALRPSLAAAMIQLTDPQPDDIFLDVMCGSGTLLRERLAFGPYNRQLGGDIDPVQVKAAIGNTRDWKRRRQPKDQFLSCWDASALPLAGGTVTKGVAYLPDSDMQPTGLPELYTGTLRELSRVLAPGGRAVFLSREYELVKDVVRQVPGLVIETGYSVLVNGRWHRLYIATKQ